MSDALRVAQQILARALLIQEACASVAFSHPKDCVCLTCRAAAGDHDALMAVLVAIEEEKP